MAKYKLDRWKTLIAEWQRSGKTREKFCKEKDVTVATFSYWRTKINKLEKVNPESPARDGFIRYTLPPTGKLGYSIEWPDGMKLRIPTGIGVQEIAGLLVSLRKL